MISKISIGTAQFGLDYGVANLNGKPSFQKSNDIINEAKSSGIYMLDTASAYGNSESVLGDIGISEFDITTKIPSIPCKEEHIEKFIENIINNSLLNLKIKKLNTVLVHDSKQLADRKYFNPIYKTLISLKERNIVSKIGVSIYKPSELDKIKDIYKFDIVQSPLNIVDRRLETSGWVDKLKKNDIEIQARSIFLQGLLLMSKNSRPMKFNKWKNLWVSWDDWCLKEDISPISACLNFILNQEFINSIVLGVDSKNQLKEICNCVKNSSNSFPGNLSSDDEFLINPVLWSALKKND